VSQTHVLEERFEQSRGRLRAVAYRMLGSTAEADDALQDSWLKISRADPSTVENLDGWLTTVVARVSLDRLRWRKSRREESLEVHIPDPIISPDEDGMGPEDEALLADSVGIALLVVLETLTPAERLAFVLHDMFAVPFDEIAPMVDRSPAAVRQLASRARRRLQGDAPTPDRDLARQREVVDAFYAASRRGDFEGLVSLLDPDVVLRVDGGPSRPTRTTILRGAETVASQARMGGMLDTQVSRVLVNGTPGAVIWMHGRVFSLMALTVTDGRIAAIDIIFDPERLAGLDLTPPEA
jgi:RNA polymerase sigma factor (sigma-70 family)